VAARTLVRTMRTEGRRVPEDAGARPGEDGRPSAGGRPPASGDPVPAGTAPRGLDALLGASPAMRRLKERVARLLPTSVTVLIQGETGTGKELLARAIHDEGPRRRGPFVPINCGALPAALLESELFGHERGAFTGAVGRRTGRVAEAAGGTLFLDEIGELPPVLQCKLLRLLQEGEVQRVGADRPVAVDVRVVAATNRDLRALAAQALFRADCYYRLSGFTVEVPPLRERGDDVLLLAAALIERFARELARAAPRLDAEAAGVLRRYRWPGNVRELENVLRACVLYCDAPVLAAADVLAVLGEQTEPLEVAAAGADLEEVLRRCAGNVTRAAHALRVSRPTLYKRMRDRGLDWTAYRDARLAGAPPPRA
jgi:two-component system response regulator HydG